MSTENWSGTSGRGRRYTSGRGQNTPGGAGDLRKKIGELKIVPRIFRKKICKIFHHEAFRRVSPLFPGLNDLMLYSRAKEEQPRPPPEEAACEEDDAEVEEDAGGLSGEKRRALGVAVLIIRE